MPFERPSNPERAAENVRGSTENEACMKVRANISDSLFRRGARGVALPVSSPTARSEGSRFHRHAGPRVRSFANKAGHQPWDAARGVHLKCLAPR